MLDRAGSHSPASRQHFCKFNDVSEEQSLIDGGKAVMMTSDCSMGATESGFLLTRNGSVAEVQTLQILQFADLVRDR